MWLLPLCTATNELHVANISRSQNKTFLQQNDVKDGHNKTTETYSQAFLLFLLELTWKIALQGKAKHTLQLRISFKRVSKSSFLASIFIFFEGGSIISFSVVSSTWKDTSSSPSLMINEVWGNFWSRTYYLSIRTSLRRSVCCCSNWWCNVVYDFKINCACVMKIWRHGSKFR